MTEKTRKSVTLPSWAWRYVAERARNRGGTESEIVRELIVHQLEALGVKPGNLDPDPDPNQTIMDLDEDETDGN